MKIYTKTGDQGTTRLLGMTEVSKADLRLCAYGSTDELNSVIGWAALVETTTYKDLLKKIQCELFTIGSWLACEDESFFAQLPKLKPELIDELEVAIDEMTEQMPKLTAFILPGGSEGNARFHMARTTARNCERQCINYFIKDPDFVKKTEVIIFLNRLSDYFFTRARFASHLDQVNEVVWKP
jgi:cob(I)alamin adenosyltransferase